jgi:hypothetical protein
MKEQFTIYTAKNGSKYIQTKNHRVANIVHDVTNVRYYKITIQDELIFSFQYSDELMHAIEVLDGLRLV